MRSGQRLVVASCCSVSSQSLDVIISKTEDYESVTIHRLDTGAFSQIPKSKGRRRLRGRTHRAQCLLASFQTL